MSQVHVFFTLAGLIQKGPLVHLFITDSLIEDFNLRIFLVFLFNSIFQIYFNVSVNVAYFYHIIFVSLNNFTIYYDFIIYEIYRVNLLQFTNNYLNDNSSCFYRYVLIIDYTVVTIKIIHLIYIV